MSGDRFKTRKQAQKFSKRKGNGRFDKRVSKDERVKFRKAA